MLSEIGERLYQDVLNLKITEGPLAGEEIEILDWQKELIEAVATHTEILLSMPRGNGKTTVVASLATSALNPKGALFVPRGQIVLVASSLKQATIAFNHIKFFMWDEFYDDNGKERKGIWRIIDNTHEKSIEHRPTGTKLQAIGSDSDRAHGLAPSFILADEPSRYKRQGESLIVALVTGMIKQDNPKMVVIGTQSDTPDHWFNKMLSAPNEHRWSKNYCASKEDIEKGREFELDVIRKANPSYDHLKALRAGIDRAIIKAKNEGDTALASYRALHLNSGTPETDEIEMIVQVENWRAVTFEVGAPRQGPVAIGIDLGGGNSMSAISFYFPETGRLEAYGAFPALPSLTERGRRDGIGEDYQVMKKRGELTVYPGWKTNNVKFLKDRLNEIADYKWIGVAADNYAKTEVQQVFLEAHYDMELLDFRRVGAGPHGKEDVEAFQTEVLTAYMSVERNLALDYAILKSRIRRDPNGNPSLQKAAAKGRIDVLQASLLAVGMGYRWRKPYEQRDGLGAFWDKMLESGKFVGSA